MALVFPSTSSTMSEKTGPKWALPLYSVVAVLLGYVVYDLVRGKGFNLLGFAVFAAFAAFAIEAWRKRRKGNDTMDNDTPQNREPPVRKELRVRNTLRRLVEGLLEHVRDLSGRVDELSADEVAQAQARFTLIAELMWAAIVDEKNKPDGESSEQE